MKKVEFIIPSAAYMMALISSTSYLLYYMQSVGGLAEMYI